MRSRSPSWPRLVLLPATVVALLPSCDRCQDARTPRRASDTSRPATRAAGRPAPLEQLERAFARERSATAALELAEAIKCRRLRRALIDGGVTPHALPVIDRAAMPALGDHEAALSFFFHKGRIHRYLVIGRGQPRALRPLLARSLDPLLIKARDELELGDLDPPALARLWRLLQQSHQRLLADVEPHLAGVRHLVVLPDGLVKYVPLHVLLAPGRADAGRGTPRRSWPFAATQRSFSYAPCLTLVRPSTRRPRSALVFAPGYGRRSTPMAGVEREAIEAARGVGSNTSVLSGARVTAAALTRALANEGARVHFAGHGLSALDEPSAAGRVAELILARGGSLTAAAAAREPLHAPLIVLASCTTGYAARFRDDRRLTPPFTLVEALLAAGARSVVAASWSVKDRESARQMAVYYRHLAEDNVDSGPAAALGSVYRQRIAGIVPPHPRFWGAYALFGAWRWADDR